MKFSATPTFSLWHSFLLPVGRVMMGWIYVESGFRKLTGMDAFIASLVRRSVPYPTVLGWIGAPLEFFGGLALCSAPGRAAARSRLSCSPSRRR